MIVITWNIQWCKGCDDVVDPQRIAFYGLSYGGKTAMRVPALLARYCLSICSADFNEWATKCATVESPYSYLMTRRIERAMSLLRRGDLSVTEVCFEVGCSSLGTFSTRFTELVGVSPSTYRREASGATTGIPSCEVKKATRPVRNREAGP